jgi:uncharacterized RDD family membrane protein YckC
MDAHAAPLGVTDESLAAPGLRFIAWIVDALIAGVVFIPLNPALYSDGTDRSLFFALFVAAVVLWFVCFVAFDGGRRGATPGKRVVGIRVADEQTCGPIGYRRAAVRRVVYILGGLALYVGWLWVFFDSRHQAWHDKAADSVVIRAR